jgi:D-arabinose 1-dehydrogenase-like Zn-dependent alcohol dehydrogenase
MIDKKIRIEDINFALKELVDRKVRGRNIVVWD